ncbi:MAG TPA: hypothetical protein VGI88_14235 [Verrucomicrobiae bacterium]|jgi:hypothetical protein
MKTSIVFGIMALAAASLVAAESTSKENVSSAAKALGAKANYSWKSTVAVPPDSRFHPGPTEGKTEKDGATRVSMTFNNNTTEIVMQGGKSAVHTEDGGWQSVSELDDQGPGRFIGGMIRNFKAPAAQASELAGQTKELTKDGNVYSGDLTEDGAKALLQFRGGNATVSGAKGSVKFWIQDGVLTKYEFKVTGKVNFNGNDRDVDRTTAVEIKDVGATKVEVPDEAKKKLS